MADTTPTLAELLRTARMQHGYSRTQLAAATKVPLAFIVAVEEEDCAALPAAVFCRGFLRILAPHLQLDCEHLLNAYDTLPLTSAPVSPSLVARDMLSDLRTYPSTVRHRQRWLFVLAFVLLGGTVWYFFAPHKPPSPQFTPRHIASPPPVSITPSAVRQNLRVQVLRPLQVDLTLDAEPHRTRLLLPQSYEFTFEQRARLVLSDATAVKLWFNGETIGNLVHGERRRVLIFQATTTARAEENADHHFQR